MKRMVIGGRNRVLTTSETRFVSGAELIADFATHEADVAAAEVIVWAWYALDMQGRPDVNATLRGTEIILNQVVRYSLPLIFLSTDAVFSGREGQYSEVDTPDPQTEYARIKVSQEGMLADYSCLRFTTFGPSYNSARSLLVEMIADAAISIDRPRHKFSPISTVSLNRVIDVVARLDTKPRVYHLTSEAITKTDCFERIGRAVGVPLPQVRNIDTTSLDLSLTSTSHNFSLASEIDLAVAEWRRLRV